MTLSYRDAKGLAKGSVIYDVLPQTAIKGIVSTQTITTTYDVIRRNYYEQIVSNSVSATLLKLQAITRVIKFRSIHLCDQSVQLYINNICFVYWVGTVVDHTIAVQQKYSNTFQRVRWIT